VMTSEQIPFVCVLDIRSLSAVQPDPLRPSLALKSSLASIAAVSAALVILTGLLMATMVSATTRPEPT
jgi:hypothetical protein